MASDLLPPLVRPLLVLALVALVGIAAGTGLAGCVATSEPSAGTKGSGSGQDAGEHSPSVTPNPGEQPAVADPQTPGHLPDGGGEPTMPVEPAPTPSGSVFVYVGSASGSITRYRLDLGTGALGDPRTVSPGGNPSFLALHPSGHRLYAVLEDASQVAAFSIAPTDGTLTEVGGRPSSAGQGPAHLSVDKSGKWVLVSNYGSGHAGTLSIGSDGALGTAATDVVLAGANAHLIDTDPSNAFAFVPCKGADHIATYAFDAASGSLTPNGAPVATAPGAGPRHLAFHPSRPFAYGINELGNTVDVFGYTPATGTLSHRQTLDTLPSGVTQANTTAEIVVHPSGKFVIGSNRGHDSLVVYAIAPSSGELSLVGHTPTGGRTPRSFAVTPDGSLVLVANAGSNEIRAFRFDAGTGGLTAEGKVAEVASPHFVGAFFVPDSSSP